MTEELDSKRLSALLDAAAQLPRSIEPPAGAWDAISARVGTPMAAASLSPAATDTADRRRRGRWRLAAAAAVLIAASSGVTAWVLRDRGESAVVAAVSAPSKSIEPASDAPQNAVQPMLPIAAPRGHPTETSLARPERATVVAVAANAGSAEASRVFAAFDVYQRATDELERSVHDRRSQFDPRSMAILDTCLRKIDEAIAEARDALSRNPQSPFVNRALSTSYRQKIDLLKRVAESPLRTL